MKAVDGFYNRYAATFEGNDVDGIDQEEVGSDHPATGHPICFSHHAGILSTTSTRRRLIAGVLGLPAAAALATSPVFHSRFDFGGSGALAQASPVLAPAYQDLLVLDSETIAWDALGPRKVRGIVYHRLEAPLEAADSFLRTLPPGGPNFCEQQFGGCTVLFDFGIDHDTGSIVRWNDPAGDTHPGVSPDRSGWANGPVDNPSTDAGAFLADSESVNPESVNRDQVSIAISGGFDDSMSDDCILSIGWLSAYFSDDLFEDWNAYPTLPNKGYSFIRKHKDFNSQTTCPGGEFDRRLQDIVAQTQSVMKFFREG